LTWTGIVADILPYWFGKYNSLSGELIDWNIFPQWEVESLVKDSALLQWILEKPDFFYHLEPLPDVVEYFQKLLDEDYQLVFLTQLPRNSEFAARDKRNWVKKYFPKFDTRNMIFTHRKELVRGALLLDDNPTHLINWKAMNPDKRTITIDYSYNREQTVDYRLNKQTAWKDFYNYIKQTT
jgi:5'(3')-deoxyribonucleotidase